MKRLTILATLGLLALMVAPVAHASFGLEKFDVTFTEKDGSPTTQAGSHPYAMRTTVHLNEIPNPAEPSGAPVPDEELKDLIVKLPAGFAGNPLAVPACQTVDFLKISPVTETPSCPDSTAVGTIRPELNNPGLGAPRAVFNLTPPPGVISKIGFVVVSVPITIEITLNPNPPHNVIARVPNLSQAAAVYGSELTLWGNPADPSHDPQRGACIIKPETECHISAPEIPFMTLPTSCRGPLLTSYEADSWQNPGRKLPSGEPDLSDPAWVSGSSETHYPTEPPIPLPTSGCASLPFKPTISAKPTTLAASSPTGLDFSLDVNDEGLQSPTGRANSYIRKAVVTLPEGFSANPSLAEGLNVCTEAQLAAETAFSAPGAGCPNAAKIGTVEVETPVLQEKVTGSLYIAKPYENPYTSLLALYIVIKNPTLGIVIRQPLRVSPDPVTGQLTTIGEDLPELPFSHFRLHFREGTRSPLASPPGCGTHQAKAELTPWSGTAPITTTSAFQITTGPEGGGCPSGGLPPFKPGLLAGTLNNAAGRFSPFNVRLSRTDAEQEITHFSIKLPPGVVGKLAGIPFCPEAAIAAAKARTGPHGGQEELDAPSCPAASEIGHTLVGAGVGPTLAYAPGKIYLAGPYHGSALSLVAITAGRVGPFDIGTVVVRDAFKIDPETAEVFIDATGSDPIPHIIKGIPVHLRDIRAYTDRPEFVLNPSSCKRTSTASTLLGSGLDFGSEADDRPVTVSTPFQAADCAALPFKPRLSLALKGGTKRGSYPALRANLQMNGFGEAGIASAQVTLPRSEFIANAHFKTICTRVQFKAGKVPGEQCPAGSIYGYASASTPILSDPLVGPLFLRSSEHQLPDLVASLHNGEIDVVLVGHVDSVKGRLRNTFEATPDAPVSSVHFSLFGGKKGLFENSTDLCRATHRAEASFTGHNGKQQDLRPALKVKCKGKSAKGKRRP